MRCEAFLVIALLGGIMVGWTSGDYSDAGNTAFLMYALGIVCVLVAAIMLKKTKPFSGEAAPFVMGVTGIPHPVC